MSDDGLRDAVRALCSPAEAPALLSGLAAVLVPEVADWCLMDVLEPPDLVTRLVALGRDGPLTIPSGSGSVDAQRSSAQALGALSRLVESPDRRLRLGAQDLASLVDAEDPRLRSQARLALSLGASDVLILGMTHRDELFGVLTVARATGSFTASQQDVLSDVAALGGLALDDLRLRALERGVSTALQRSLLPRLPVVPGLTLAARFTPAAGGLAVGGDWYDVFGLPGGDVAVAVGDATGHDVQAATRMAELRTLLRAVAVDRQDSPASTLTRLDTIVARLSPDLSGTCVYGRLDLDASGARLIWSSAGHLPPVLLRHGAATLLESPPDLMLGVRVATTRQDHTRVLEPGDVVVLYTDGLVEHRRAGLDQRLAELARTVEAIAGQDLERLVDLLVERLPAGDDDVAVLALRVDAPDPVSQ